MKDKGSRQSGGDAVATKAVESKPDGHVEGAGKDEVNLASGAEAAVQQLDVKTNGLGRKVLCSLIPVSSYEYHGIDHLRT